MGAHYTQTYWHYSNKGTFPPFAIKTILETDTRAGFRCELASILFHEDLNTRTKRYYSEQWDNERLESFAKRFWKGAREHGAKNLTDYEYDRYFTHLIDAIQTDVRKEYIYD